MGVERSYCPSTANCHWPPPMQLQLHIACTHLPVRDFTLCSGAEASAWYRARPSQVDFIIIIGLSRPGLATQTQKSL